MIKIEIVIYAVLSLQILGEIVAIDFVTQKSDRKYIKFELIIKFSAQSNENKEKKQTNIQIGDSCFGRVAVGE